MDVTPLPRGYGGGFERIPNEAIDDPGLSNNALGLLNRLLRSGKEFAGIDELAAHYANGDPGRHGWGIKAFRAAARELADAGYLTRVKTRDAAGRLSTRVRVSAIPQVAPTGQNGPSVRAGQTGETAGGTDRPKRPVGTNSGNTVSPQVAPTGQNGPSVRAGQTGETAGGTDRPKRPVGTNSGNTVSPQVAADDPPPLYADCSDSDSLSRLSPNPAGEREIEGASPTHLADVQAVIDAYGAASGRPVVNGTRTKLAKGTTALLAAGYPADYLADRARELAVEGWTDLEQHVARSKVPVTRAEAAPARLPIVDCRECTRPTRSADHLCPACREQVTA